MMSGFNRRKILCKNEADYTPENYIRMHSGKMPGIAAFWGQLMTGESDKESSHVVGISSDAGVR